jgi:ATP-dependent RNA helicase DeaD
VAVYGGQAMNRQLESLQRGVHIVVATPGRLMDHMQRGTLQIGQVRSVVLDEADQMLDIGFADDIDYILRHTPRTRQTLLFSATMPGQIKRLAGRYLREPSWIRIGGDAEPVEQVEQQYYEVADLDRPFALDGLLRQPDLISQALVFRRTKLGVDRLVAYLQGRGHDAQAIHGDMTQSHRDRVMSRFRSQDLRILIATNVAARGLDIPAVSHVINYDMPGNLEEYVHRIGRTARMGRPGTAITFVSEWDFQLLDLLQAHLGDELRPGTLALSYR